MTKKELEEMRNVDIRTVDPSTLVDIKSITIDSKLPKNEKILQFMKQIKNPYLYRCGDIIVKNSFCETEKSIEDNFENYLRKLC